MRHATGQIGRVVLARFDHGEAVVPALVDLSRAERIRAGSFFCSAPSRAAGSSATRRRRRSRRTRTGGAEVLTGCIRKEGNVFIVVEAMIVEVAGVAASRMPDEKTGLELLSLA